MILFTVLGAGIFIYWSVCTVLAFMSDCDLELFFCEKFGKSPRRLKGKVVFITGASSGIGEFTAYALAKFGVKLALAARRPNELLRVKRKCLELSKNQLSDRDVLVVPMDVTDFQSHKKHFQYAVQHFGHIDILFNNAGRSQRALWENIDLEVDKQMFDLNVFGPVNLTRIALEHFNRVGSGHIAVVTSLAGVMGVPYSGSYCGTKFSEHGYFNALRIEKLPQNIHVTLLCPGPTYTNFLAESFTDKPGEKYGVSVQPTDKRMTAERCGYLNAVALANKTKESWIAIRPIIPLTYMMVYFPVISGVVLKILGPNYLYKLRDSKDEVNIV
ncbi:unnamed protein product [Acanthoscelides obtectus]|uniref:Dehydrogenase/reductase SDR family member 7 n=1 Tax=Acanthoscelides obtectus TaxID=200917 RepID=A0A9P0KNI9_ACAOB|nr:unnamed protein product [Acanthoscelides obtectus]CAK1660593.1 Dehydrogenase/reductase SDR family member 7 [Acanthoscelides obtectus]